MIHDLGSYFWRYFPIMDVPEPLEEAVLVDELDGAGADAGVEEGPVGGPLAAAHAANVARSLSRNT